MRLRKMADPGVVVVLKATRFDEGVGKGHRRIAGVCYLSYDVAVALALAFLAGGIYLAWRYR
jgi:hypothetical protein